MQFGLMFRAMQWLKKPFDPEMDVAHWFLFFGLLIVISVFWKMIMSHIEE